MCFLQTCGCGDEAKASSLLSSSSSSSSLSSYFHSRYLYGLELVGGATQQWTMWSCYGCCFLSWLPHAIPYIFVIVIGGTTRSILSWIPYGKRIFDGAAGVLFLYYAGGSFLERFYENRCHELRTAAIVFGGLYAWLLYRGCRMEDESGRWRQEQGQQQEHPQRQQEEKQQQQQQQQQQQRLDGHQQLQEERPEQNKEQNAQEEMYHQQLFRSHNASRETNMDHVATWTLEMNRFRRVVQTSRVLAGTLLVLRWTGGACFTDSERRWL